MSSQAGVHSFARIIHRRRGTEGLRERVALYDLNDAVYASRKAEELAERAIRRGALRNRGGAIGEFERPKAAKVSSKPATEVTAEVAAKITAVLRIGNRVGRLRPSWA